MAPPPTSHSPVSRALPDRVRLVVLFGGRSAEHDISCISARHVIAAADPRRYDIEPIGITRDGQFVAAGYSDGVLAATGEPLAPGDALARSAPLPGTHRERDDESIGPVSGAGGVPTGSTGIPTVVFPILHGPNGEDGTIQGTLEIAGIPYVGSAVLSSALSMDKAMAKTVLAALGIPQTPWRTIRAHRLPDDDQLATMLDELGPVVFVKPANMGSSIGVSRVTSQSGPKALADALSGALAYDDVVVAEAGVEGRELECAVLGNTEPRASVLGEVVTDATFYDYSNKYFDGTATTVIPAELDDATMAAGRDLAVRTFEALRCEGLARVDLFLEADGGFLVNEVNTIPGFTEISMYPKLWAATGLGYPELIDELVALALERHERHASRSVEPA